jgi:hypothetical protein
MGGRLAAGAVRVSKGRCHQCRQRGQPGNACTAERCGRCCSLVACLASILGPSLSSSIADGLYKRLVSSTAHIDLGVRPARVTQPPMGAGHQPRGSSVRAECHQGCVCVAWPALSLPPHQGAGRQHKRGICMVPLVGNFAQPTPLALRASAPQCAKCCFITSIMLCRLYYGQGRSAGAAPTPLTNATNPLGVTSGEG